MKSVLISINPKWCELIANGKKTIEVRKTRPKLETPFKCYIYCTVGGDALCPTQERLKSDYRYVNGKVIGEFVCKHIEIMRYPHINLVDIVDERESCVSAQELIQYSNGSLLYAWHISDLKIYDKPKELSEFKNSKNEIITRAFQSWCYVESEE